MTENTNSALAVEGTYTGVVNIWVYRHPLHVSRKLFLTQLMRRNVQLYYSVNNFTLCSCAGPCKQCCTARSDVFLTWLLG